MTLLTENTRKIVSPIVVLAVLVLSIALFFVAGSPLAGALPFVGWILLALVVLGALSLGWLAWGDSSTRTTTKSAVRDLTTSRLLVVVFESVTIVVAIVAVFTWLAPVMGLSPLLVVPFVLGFASIVALVLDFLSKTGRLAERWRSLEVGASVVAVLAIVAALLYLVVGA
ncbi:hypothetical protein GCM10022239_22830 [Leifsonia bigeumensis]|uniref:Uncharacterized protein n=1 Tax=Leifsonella bigeumensis TaxID=433643 RepID=A0ABP7FSQ3_9MICO